MRKRLIVAGVVFMLLAWIVTLLWHALECPPPRLLLKYGLPPAGGPTGRTKIIAGMEFVEVGPGYCYFDVDVWWRKGNAVGRLCSRLGLPFGEHPHRPKYVNRRRWIEVRAPYWISRIPLVRAEDWSDEAEAMARARASLRGSREDSVLRYATADELQFADVTEALDFGDGARGMTPFGGVVGGKRLSAIVLLGERWRGRDLEPGEIGGWQTGETELERRSGYHLVWVPREEE